MHLSSLDTRPWQSCVAVALGSKRVTVPASAETGSTKIPLQERSLDLRPVGLCPFTVDGRPRLRSFTVGLLVDVGLDPGLLLSLDLIRLFTLSTQGSSFGT